MSEGVQARKRAFIELMIAHEVLRFGDFTLKSGRRSPYFFNLGAIDDGAGISALGDAYADALVAADRVPEVVFGPAYKGIPIAVATAMALQRRHGLNVGVAFNRKEAKDHGEGGQLVGHPLSGRIVMVDDVMTAGTAAREAAALIASGGASLDAVLVALDRQELLESGRTAVGEVARLLRKPVISIITLTDVVAYLEQLPDYQDELTAIISYQRSHCLVDQ